MTVVSVLVMYWVSVWVTYRVGKMLTEGRDGRMTGGGGGTRDAEGGRRRAPLGVGLIAFAGTVWGREGVSAADATRFGGSSLSSFGGGLCGRIGRGEDAGTYGLAVVFGGGGEEETGGRGDGDGVGGCSSLGGGSLSKGGRISGGTEGGTGDG